MYPETQCPWPKLRCGKLNVAFGNELQLCHLHTLILGSTGGIIICQTCLHNEEVSREISWRSTAINMRVLPRHFYADPSLLLPSHLLPLIETEVPARSPWSSTVGWSSMCHVLRRFSDSLTPFTSSPAHSAQGVMLCQ